MSRKPIDFQEVKKIIRSNDRLTQMDRDFFTHGYRVKKIVVRKTAEGEKYDAKYYNPQGVEKVLPNVPRELAELIGLPQAERYGKKSDPRKRVGKTAKEKAGGVLNRHDKNTANRKEENRERAREAGCGKGANNSAEKAGLGAGKTKK
jgi:hypothetical protein